MGAGLAVTVLLALSLAGCSSPTAPTPPPAPPPPPPEVIPDPPTLTCPASVSASTITRDGAVVSFTLPVASKGKEPVTVSCTPASNTRFPLGDTFVECTATDALSRTASCSFYARVELLPSLRRTRFLAFGDSLTQGEVSNPVTAGTIGSTSGKQVVVPAAAYPAVLTKLLHAAYRLQEDDITVANYGISGERASAARERFIAALGIVRPDAVLLMQGANDIPLGEDRAASTAANEVRMMAAEAKSRGMRVFIATLPPGRPGSNRAINQALLDDYNRRMRDVANTEGAILVDIYAALVSNASVYIGQDGLHATEAGYAKMAETFFNAIRAEFEVR